MEDEKEIYKKTKENKLKKPNTMRKTSLWA